ncbi:hypothetical protein CYMTET_18400 [Cymbomonas tetramitiformis]|uniref:ACT domain-containing protein n=1 Tax=Cymbomonas tetramitiformis TaxID=36881 RepID=A0AAE0L6C4_9CHLO|nr:hypothetical protein CYMTET_18400 [Cymbomonas tetramitiformis]
MSAISYQFSTSAPVINKQPLKANVTRCLPKQVPSSRSLGVVTFGAKFGATQRSVCRPLVCRAAAATEEGSARELPQPKVLIDNLSDPLATILIIEFAGFLGELVDTMGALRNLGLDITRASLDTDGGGSQNCFYVTDSKTSEKITASERLEEIRNTVLSNMIQFHPEAEELIATGHKVSQISRSNKERDPLAPRKDPPIPTSIKVFAESSGHRSRLDIVTTDRAGLLVDIVTTLKDISVNVISAEIDTVGMMAHDILFLTYQGRALSPPMEELVRNALYYYLAFSEVETDESY